MNLRLWALIALLCAAGCGDDDVVTDAGTDSGVDAGILDGAIDSDLPMDGGTDVGDDASMASLCPTDDVVLAEVEGEAAIALISSDFVSTAVSLLDGEETVIAVDWITSGTTAPALTSTLSGDVTFPTAQVDDGTLLITDRANGVVSRFCIGSGSLVGQLAVGIEGFAGNPQDAVVVGDVGYATRYDPNTNPDAPEGEEGSDIIGFDPQTMTRNGTRIDLSEFGGTVTGQEGGEEADVQIAARPSRMVVVGDTLVVALERTPIDQASPARGFGEGRLALFDLNTLERSIVEIPGGANCGQVVPVEGAADQVIVACKGYSLESFGGPGVSQTAGLFLVSIEDGAGTIINSWQPEDDAAFSPVWSILSVGGTRVVGVDIGDFATGSSDRLGLVDLSDGNTTELYEADGAFALGQGIYLGEDLRIPHAPFGEDPEVVQVGLDGTASSLQYTDSLPSVALTRL